MLSLFSTVQFEEKDIDVNHKSSYNNLLNIYRSGLKKYNIITDTLSNLYLDNRLAVKYACRFKAKIVDSEVDNYFMKVDVLKNHLIYSFVFEAPTTLDVLNLEKAIKDFDDILSSFRFYY